MGKLEVRGRVEEKRRGTWGDIRVELDVRYSSHLARGVWLQVTLGPKCFGGIMSKHSRYFIFLNTSLFLFLSYHFALFCYSYYYI